MAGYVNNSTIIYDLVTFPFKWKVKRHDTDFKALRNYLVRHYPQTIVPPLPKFHKTKRYTPKQLLKKSKFMQRFLQSVMKSQILRGSDFLVQFLKEPSIEEFHVKVMSSKLEQGPKSIMEFKTLTGEIEIQSTQKAKEFCENLSEFVTISKESTGYISQKCKELQIKSHDLADEYFAIAGELKRLASANQKCEVPQLVMLYDKMSQIISANGSLIMN